MTTRQSLLLAAVCGFALALTQSACTGEPVCNPKSCPTGCCMGETCVEPGNQTDTSCGNRGIECVACSTGRACKFGFCQSPGAGGGDAGGGSAGGGDAGGGSAGGGDAGGGSAGGGSAGGGSAGGGSAGGGSAGGGSAGGGSAGGGSAGGGSAGGGSAGGGSAGGGSAGGGSAGGGSAGGGSSNVDAGVDAGTPLVFTSVLNRAQEVPAIPLDGGSNGTARCTLNGAETSLECTVTFAQLTGAPTMMHVHQRAATGAISGSVVLDFAADGSVATSPVTRTFAVGAATVTALKARELYVNVHTTGFSGGEIRGQLMRPGDSLYRALLVPGEEVNASPMPTTGSGAVLLVTRAAGAGYFGAASLGQSDGGVGFVMAAHIHTGPAGVNGPVLETLSYTTAQDQVNFGGLVGATLNTTLLDSNGYYVNVHTAEHTGGQIRGQLIKLFTAPN